MGDCTTIFETLTGFLPMNIMEKAIDETGADHGTKKFTVLRQLNTMMYANLTQKESLRDITEAINADSKLREYTGTISFSQLSRRNSQREPEIFRIIFEAVLAKLKKHHGIRIIPGNWGILKILDSTIMRICLSLFPWACYRKTKAAVKMHTLYDINCGCPESILVTEGIVHDKEKMNAFVAVSGYTYIFDRGYLEYKEFDRYCKEDIFFVTRLKKNAVMQVLTENRIEECSSILSDKEVILGTFYTKMQHPLRAIEVIDASTGEPFVIATNRFDLTALEIAEIYRLRWQIELFFKWIKQHLKIKKFYGTSYNAVLNQIYAALILFILLKIMHLLVGSNYNFLKFVRQVENGPWNSLSELMDALSTNKPPGPKRRRFNWKKEYASLLIKCLVSKQY